MLVSRTAALYGTAVVALSVAVNLLHTASHAGQHVMSLPAWQLTYIAVVIYAAPVVAAVLLWTRDGLAGAWLLVAAMAGSLVFGLLYHFVVPGPDNVFTQSPGPWRTTFGVTAVLLAPLQVIGGSVGFWAARRAPRSVDHRPRETFLRRTQGFTTGIKIGAPMSHDPREEDLK